MRLAFFVLLLANLVLYAWGAGYWGRADDGREPERLQQQIAPEKLRILPAENASAALTCRRIAWLSAAESQALRDAVAARSGWEASESPRAEPPAHWVAITELSSRALAERKRTELRQLGVSEGEIVEDAALGPFAVSLGVFRGQPAAEEFLQTLAKKGVRSARLASRVLPPEKFALELRAPGGDLDAQLPALTANLADTEITACATP